MKIHPKDFRVAEGDEVDLEKWPTMIDPVYKSKAQYKHLLEARVEQLSAQQQLLYASNRHAILLIFQAMAGKGRRHQARDVRGQSAGLPAVQFQASQPPPNCSTISSGALPATCPNAAGSASSIAPAR